MRARNWLLVVAGLGPSIWAGCGGGSSGTSGAGGHVGAQESGNGLGSGSGGPSEGGSQGTDGAPGGGSPGTDAGVADASSDAVGCMVPDASSVLGTACPTACGFGTCCVAAWTDLCFAQGGQMERCVWGSGCEGAAGTCYAPPVLEAGSFPCVSTACSASEVCVHHALAGDGCESHYCQAAPTGCGEAGTCGCFVAAGSSGSSGGGPGQYEGCTQDDAGHATVTYAY